MKTYKVGVVGMGHGRSHARLVHQYLDRTECTTLCDVNPARLEKEARELGVTRTTSQYADLLADPDLDIICICSPCHIHGQMTLAALDAGKHVMVEVPLENESMDRLWKIVQLAERRHLKVQMDCPDRWIPESVRMKQLIDEGGLGEIYYVIAEYIQDMRLQGLINNVNFRMGYGVKAQEPISAGAGIYAIDTARWFLGGELTEVFAYGNRMNFPTRNVDDHEVALFRTHSGAIARVQCSKGAVRPYKEIVKSVWGTKGSLDSTGYYPAPSESTGLYGALGQDPSKPNVMHPGRGAADTTSHWCHRGDGEESRPLGSGVLQLARPRHVDRRRRDVAGQRLRVRPHVCRRDRRAHLEGRAPTGADS